MNRFLVAGIIVLVGLSTNNAFAITCSGEILVSKESGTAGQEFCCSTTATVDFQNGLARGYAEPDGRVSCCKYIECPNGASTSGGYCTNIYSRFGNTTPWLGVIKSRVCSNVNGTNVLKCNGADMFRYSNSSGGTTWWACQLCNAQNPNPSSGTYSAWSAAYMNTTKQQTGNTSWEDCRVVANRTESGCTNNIVPDYWGLSSDTHTTGSAWVHKSYGSFTAKAGYKKNTSSGTCTACGTNEYSAGGSVTSCSQCPYYTANPPMSPWGPDGWSSCGPIIEGFTSSGTLATQGVGNGNACTVGSSTNSNYYGTFVSGACNASGSDLSGYYVLNIQVGTNYCQYSNVNDWVSQVCTNGLHCSGYACMDCINSLKAGATDSTHVTITKYNLYDAQILLSQIASATSLGCLESCYID